MPVQMVLKMNNEWHRTAFHGANVVSSMCRYFVQPSCSGAAARVTYAPATRVTYGQYSYGHHSGQYGS